MRKEERTRGREDRMKDSSKKGRIQDRKRVKKVGRKKARKRWSNGCPERDRLRVLRWCLKRCL